MGTDINIKKRIAVQEESVTITSDVNSINFTGAGVTATPSGDDVIVNIPGSIGATVYYLNETITQAPYKEFSSIPTAAVEQTIATAVGVGATVTIQSFQTPSGVPNTTNIPAGLWQFYLHFSGTFGDSWDVYAEVYKRDLGGIETLLLTTDVIPTTALSAIPTMILTDGVFPASTVLTTDRIVVKVNATNTGIAGQTITFHTEGSTNYSVGTTTLNQIVPTGAVTSVTGTAPVVSSGGTTPAISMAQANGSTDGYLDSADWATFNSKQDPITLTTTGTSGAATLIANTLNIPQYQAALLLTTVGTSGPATLIGNTLNIPSYSFTDTNIYNTDGTLTGDRIVDMSTHDLSISSTNISNQYDIFFQNGTQQSQFAISLGNITNYIKNGSGDSFSNSSGATTSITAVTNLGSTIFSDITQVQGGITFRAVNGATTRRLELNTVGVRVNNAFYLPAVDGTNGQVLRTNGIGITSWVTPASGTVTSVGLTTGTTGTDINVSGSPVTGSGSITLNIPTASSTVRGALSSTDWSTFNNKVSTNIYTSDGTISGARNIDLNGYNFNIQDLLGSSTINITTDDGSGSYSYMNMVTGAVNITASGSSFSSTLQVTSGGVSIYKSGSAGAYILPITQPTANQIVYASSTTQLAFTSLKTINSNSLLGSGNISVGTVTSVAALTLGTSGTDLSSTVATGTTTPVITLNVPTASAANRGALSAADWTTFNNKANTASPAFTGTPTAPTAVTGTNTTQVATTAFVQDAVAKQPEAIQAAASDEVTNLTTGTAKVTFRMPYAMTLTAVRASLSTAQTAGALLTVDINLNGVSVLGTKLTFDNNEKTTVTAATPATIVTSALTDDGEITVDIDAVGTAGARGLKITLIGTRT